MGFLRFNFECPCGHAYKDFVEGEDGRPDACPACGGTQAQKGVTVSALARKMIPIYPGYKRQAAGYAADERRPAEKKGRQVTVPRAASSAR